MSRRDRNQSYSGRETLRYEGQEYRPNQASDRERSERERPQPREWQSYGARNRDERDYAARYLGYEAHNEPHYESRYESRQAPRYETQRFPATFGPSHSHEDEQRVRRFEDQGDYRVANDRERWGQRNEGRYGAGHNLADPYAERYGRAGQSDYNRSARYGQGEWGERSARDYGSEGQRSYGGQEHDRPWGQQLRDVGHEVVRKVKRAFRGPKGYKRSDERIREDVNDRLAQQDEFDPSEIEVSVSNAEVTLTGSVHSRHEKFLAEEISDDVSGVTEVHNQLRVNPQQSTSTGLGGTTNAENQTAGTGWSNQSTGNNRNVHS